MLIPARPLCAIVLAALAIAIALASQPAGAQNTETTFVSNMDETPSHDHLIGTSLLTTNFSYANAFTTGSNAGGYTLNSVTAKFNGKTGSPGAISAKIYSSAMQDGYAKPNAALVTLTGNNPDAAGDYTFTCPSNDGGCTLSASATYHLAFETTASAAGNNYKWRATSSDDQTSSYGWTIADSVSNKGGAGSWTPNRNLNSGLFSVSATAASAAITLAASDPTAGGATLTISNHTGSWHYKHTAPHEGTCSDAVSGATAAVTGLTAGTPYTFKAYSDSACSNEIAAAAEFTTLGVSASNLSVANSENGFVRIGRDDNQSYRQKWATKFSTGARAGGYELQSVTAGFLATQGSPGAISAAIHADDGGKPASAAALVTLTNTDGNPAAAGDYVFTCPSGDSGCILSSNTDYHLVLDQANASIGENNFYKWRAVADNGQTITGAADWTIADGSSDYRSDGSAWTANLPNHSGRFRVSAVTEHIYLAASDFTQAVNKETLNAKLTLGGPHTGDWYHKQTAPAAGTCSSAVSGTTATLMNLTAGTTYTFKAYSDSGCSTEIAAASFTARGAGARRIGSEISDQQIPAGSTLRFIWSEDDDLRAHGTVWATHYKTTNLSGGVWAFNALIGNRDTDKEFNLDSDNGHPWGIGASPTTFYISDDTDKKIYAYSREGANARDAGKEFVLDSANANPQGIWLDDDTMWVADDADGKLYAYNLSNRSRDTSKEFNLHSNNANSSADNGDPTGIWSNGKTMWVADDVDDKIYAYNLSDGTRYSGKDYTLHSDNADPIGIWSDGELMWVADSVDRRIYAYNAIDNSVKVLRLRRANQPKDRATLTIAKWTGGDWYYKHTVPDGGACTKVSGISYALVKNLAPATNYTFKAYSDANCSVEVTTDATDVQFTTDPVLTHYIRVFDDRARLSFAGRWSPWYYKHTASHRRDLYRKHRK